MNPGRCIRDNSLGIDASVGQKKYSSVSVHTSIIMFRCRQVSTPPRTSAQMLIKNKLSPEAKISVGFALGKKNDSHATSNVTIVLRHQAT